MAKKNISWKTKGMNRDISVSAFNSELAFENRNIRLSTNDGNTLMSWVNEKGTKKMKIGIEYTDKEGKIKYKDMDLSNGTPVGTAVLNYKLVVFVAKNQNDIDSIYVFEIPKANDASLSGYDLIGRVLFEGELDLNPKYPLSTLVSYESEDVQKVYWIDDDNPPKFINIASGKLYEDANSFNFIPKLDLKETVTVEKIYGSGEFAPGVIQYALTYYNRYGQESAIFYTTPLQYISYFDRGGSPESKIANSFKITITDVDTQFEYLRIYSIQRTSKNATPFCKRVQDIKIADSSTISYIDTGYNGDTVDPTELLYKGGEDVRVKTMEQKDGTLFLGNIKTLSNSKILDVKKYIEPSKVSIDEEDKDKKIDVKKKINITTKALSFKGNLINKENFYYTNSISSSGFKRGEYYRIGIQFQYKTGKWSEPLWIKDYKIKNTVTVSGKEVCAVSINEKTGVITLPHIQVTINDYTNIINPLVNAEYRKARLLMAEPSETDRTILCQGIANSCVYRESQRYQIKNDDNGVDYNKAGNLYGQSSWIFRPWYNAATDLTDAEGGAGYVPSHGDIINLKGMDAEGENFTKVLASPKMRSIEIGALTTRVTSAVEETIVFNEESELGEGEYTIVESTVLKEKEDYFKIDQELITVHSPETIFNDTFYSIDWNNMAIQVVGGVHFSNTYGDIDIQTSSPTIGNANGFVHRSVKTVGNAALISGLYYEDYIVDDINSTPTYGKTEKMKVPVSFPVYMWHHNGSLNNDVTRTGRSAELLKKKICNYHQSDITTYTEPDTESFSKTAIDYFESEEISLLKLDGKPYMGNIDTMISTSNSPKYFVGNPSRSSVDTNFLSRCYYRLGPKDLQKPNENVGVNKLNNDNGKWVWEANTSGIDKIGDKVTDLASTNEPIRMKYKSTPHIVVLGQNRSDNSTIFQNAGQLFQKAKMDTAGLPLVEITRTYNSNALYGGQTTDALKENVWIPISEPVYMTRNTELTLTSGWGDTWFQRYECMKTYPFTTEDVNQVIDIASFMLETHTNIDGRYDRNRGQINNLNSSPKNFNLLNPVYSQMNNFFNYKILDDNDYKDTWNLNTLTWTKTKQSGADVDLWTNITLASTLEMDGDKGAVNKLARLNNQLICFQDSGVSQILYNENTQISSTEGVPIEIANSGKVQGKRYFSDTVGCSNKWSVVQTPSGIYFIDSNEKSIYLFNGQLSNLSTEKGFNTWAKQNIPSAEIEWNPEDFNNFVAYYDKLNQEVLFINDKEALAYSEKFNCFTSFYDYGGTPYFSSLDDIGIWLRKGNQGNLAADLWQYQAGEYCNFFGENKPFSMTLIGNQEPQLDKIFTNLEFRACVEGDGTYDEEKNKFIPTLPFDTLEVWNEFQHGKLALSNRNSSDRFTHGTLDGNGYLNRKFRIWRCDIPRDNAAIDTDEEAKMGIKRFKAKPLDRIRNTWAYLKLSKKAAEEGSFLSKVEVHDIVATYFG